MNLATDALLVFLLALNFFALGTSRIAAVIRISALQGAILGTLSLCIHENINATEIVIGLANVGLKGVLIPVVLFRAMRNVNIRREMEPLIGLFPSILLGAAATISGLLIASQLPMIPGSSSGLMVPASITTVLVGFIFLTTRRKAISQVIGYLFLENGIYTFGLVLVEAVPHVVEVGVLLDLFVAIFISAIILNQINDTFSSMDTRHLTSLKD